MGICENDEKIQKGLASHRKIQYNEDKTITGRKHRMQRLENATLTGEIDFMTVFSHAGQDQWIENRKTYGLSFCRSGRIVYEKDGIRAVSNPHTAVLLPQGETYYIYREETGEFPLVNFTCIEPLGLERPVAMEIANPEVYLREFETMRSFSIFRHDRLRVLSIFYGMLHRLVQESREKIGVLTPVLAYLEQHYTDWDLSCAELAVQGGISAVYMRQLFHAQFGVSPKRYIMELRVEHARQLLGNTSMAVQEIAAVCGFGTSNHFCRLFREMTGQTPGEYRRASHRGG